MPPPARDLPQSVRVVNLTARWHRLQIVMIEQPPLSTSRWWSWRVLILTVLAAAGITLWAVIDAHHPAVQHLTARNAAVNGLLTVPEQGNRFLPTTGTVTLTSTKTGATFTVRTDSSGTFRFLVPPGTYTIIGKTRNPQVRSGLCGIPQPFLAAAGTKIGLILPCPIN